LYPDTTEAHRARHELAKHYLYEEGDYAYARALFAELIDTAKDDRDVVSALFDLSMTYWKEGRLEEQVAVLDRAMALADPPDPDDHTWTHLLMEALVYKGVAEARLGWYAQSRASLEQVLEMSPWENPHNVQSARTWLEYLSRVAPVQATDNPAKGEGGR
jgi:tetratricopeptide (TPR) repeat protein